MDISECSNINSVWTLVSCNTGMPPEAKEISIFISLCSCQLSVSSIFSIYFQKKKGSCFFICTQTITATPQIVPVATKSTSFYKTAPIAKCSSLFWPKCPISWENTWLAPHWSSDYVWPNHLWPRGGVTGTHMTMFIHLVKGRLVLKKHARGWVGTSKDVCSSLRQGTVPERWSWVGTV